MFQKNRFLNSFFAAFFILYLAGFSPTMMLTEHTETPMPAAEYSYYNDHAGDNHHDSGEKQHSDCGGLCSPCCINTLFSGAPVIPCNFRVFGSNHNPYLLTLLKGFLNPPFRPPTPTGALF